ncbi:MAG: hypothetical protein INR66_26215, partial [Gordonia polyisoprenivorans]|nr:hypothetical protein [Gordonia polyisoprenivorans]
MEVDNTAGAAYQKATYDAVGQLASVTFPSTSSGGTGNGSSGTFAFDPNTGASTRVTWTFNGTNQPKVTDAVVRSQTGRVLQNTLTSGTTDYVSRYSYDGAGRLTGAAIPHHQLSYGFGPVSGCATGANAAAGANGNRTTFSDSLDGATASTTTSCYDGADRLIGTTVANPQPGAVGVFAINLSTAPGAPGLASLVYDARGNTTKLADQTIEYDSTDRHTSTAATDGSKITYIRDVTDRIIARTTITGGTTATVYYSFNDGSDSPDWTLSAIASGTVLERTQTLVGGVVVSVQNNAAAWTWSYPNLHGDVVVTTNASGVRNPGVFLYDPFGNPLDCTTWRIGTTPANNTAPSNTIPSGTSYGWEGSHQKLYEHT